MKKAILYCDGASRGNPGPSSYGFVIFEGDEIISKDGKRIGNTTNNVAEYTALIEGLKKAISLNVEEIEIRADSQLLIRQVLGQYKVKTPHIKELFVVVMGLLKNFKKYTAVHIPREENADADEMANWALDQ
jgi:ribonuclease HI